MTSVSSVAFHPLATKISTPEYTQHYLERSRLTLSVPDSQAFKLIGIVAPAGYGKSTLMAQWKHQLEGQGKLCAWLNLDEEENDLANYFRYLVHSLYRIDPEPCREAMNTLQAGSLADPKPIWQSVIHHLSRRQRQYALFLDDFHKIVRKDVLAFTEWLVRYLPKNLTLVVASRPKLRLNLNRLKSYGEMQVYEFNELKFTLRETELFLNSFHRFGLSHEQIKSIYENSEGWVLVLQMISILAQRGQDLSEVIGSFTGKREELGEYLGEVIMESVDSDLRSLILKASVLDRFCAELLDEVLGTTTSRKLLRQIHELNLFLIPLDHENRWFRFHHLFGDFLRENLREEYPKVETHLHQKASAWFESQELLPEAIEYALRAKDFDCAARLITGYAPQIVQNKGDTTTLVQWMQRLPKEYKIKYPIIWPSLILSYNNSHNIKKSVEETQLLNIAVEKLSREKRIDDATRYFLQSNVDFFRVLAHVFDGKVQRFRHEVFEWIEKWPQGEAYQIASMKMCMGTASLFTYEYQKGFENTVEAMDSSLEIENYYAYFWTLTLMSSLYIRMGDTEKAATYSRDTISLIREKIGPNAYATHALELHWAECLYLQGKIQEAWEHLTIPLNYLESWGAHFNLMSCINSYTRLFILQNDFPKALAHLRFGQKLVKKRKHPYLLTYFKCLEIDLNLQQNHLASAQKIFESLEEDFIPTFEDRFLSAFQKELQFLAKAKISLHQNQARLVVAKLSQYVEGLRSSERVRDLIYALILQAAALHQTQHKEKSLTVLAKALELACRGEFVMPFVEHRSYLREFFQKGLEIFQEKRRGKTNADYLNRLAKQMEIKSEKPSHDPLSKRELEILNILESGKNNKELASQLFISEQTLKWHLYNLFKKFKVKNRTGLILEAKKIGVYS